MVLSRAVYTLLVWLAQPLLRRKLARRAQAEPGYAVAVPERFGHYSQPAETHAQLVWVHAVSLGEARAAAILVQALRTAWPGMRLLLTHGTATGRAEGAKLLRDGDVQVWQPWDTPAAVQAFLAHFRPRLGLLMETEVWPHLVLHSRQAGVPLVLVNARMSEQSLRSALRWPGLMRPSYAGLTAAWAQTEADAQRLRELGTNVPAVTGNLKFDARPDEAQCATARGWRTAQARPVVLLASSREGEEAQWLQAVQAQAEAWGALQWLIVPRHPQRVDEVERLLLAAGWSVSRRSQWAAQGPAAAPAQVWLGDSLGEMALYYSLADVALLGGSFAPLGGQNLIEAAACGCPVVMGPHTFNFLEAAEQAEAAGAALRVADMAEGVARSLGLATDRAQQARMAQAAQAFAQAHQGAAKRVVALAAPWLMQG
ncbi:MAG: 3-deoxy-D-manno-octulosonic acid transferase [Betaproteobacteria bacterium]|nr:3-deoxy-D-manno-octulosonic acid transferase [Betaproteobacteria bacterium]